MPRIVVTGLGCLDAVGSNVASTWEAIVSGKSGIEPVAGWDTEGWPFRLAGEIKDFQPRSFNTEDLDIPTFLRNRGR